MTNLLFSLLVKEFKEFFGAFSALTLLVGRKGIRPVKTEWWGSGVVVCLVRCADLHTAQLMPLLLTVSCFSKIQIGFTLLVPADRGSPGQRAVKRVCMSEFVMRVQVVTMTLRERRRRTSRASSLASRRSQW